MSLGFTPPPPASVTPPINPGEDSRVAYADAGDLAYAAGLLYDKAGAFVTLNTNPGVDTPAQSGSLRVNNGWSLKARDAAGAGTADVGVLDYGVTSAGYVTLGSSTGKPLSLQSSGSITMNAQAGAYYLGIAGATRGTFSTSGWALASIAAGGGFNVVGSIENYFGGASTSGTPADTWMRAAGKVVAVGAGAHLYLSGGQDYDGGRSDGSVILGQNIDGTKANVVPMVEVADVGPGQSVLALCIKALVTNGDVGAGAGDGVIAIGTATSAPTVAPGAGICTLWFDGTNLKAWPAGAGAPTTIA